MRNILIFAVSIFMAACTSGVDVVGQGDVYSSSGTHGCTAETSPCVYSGANAIDEWFQGVPRSGHEFGRWQNCPDDSYKPYCHVVFDQATVEKYHGETVPNLIALFIPEGSTRVKVQSCTVGSGMDYEALCRPYVGKYVWVNRHIGHNSVPGYLEFDLSTVQVIGFDNVTYSGNFVSQQAVYGDATSDSIMVLGPRADGGINIIKRSQSYPCSGFDCAVTLNGVVQ